MNILEEFWYGNIEPAEYDTSPSKEYKELLQLISRNEDKLLAIASSITDNLVPTSFSSPFLLFGHFSVIEEAFCISIMNINMLLIYV